MLIFQYAATPVRKPIAIYTNARFQKNTYFGEVFAVTGSRICDRHNKRTCGCRDIWSISHYEPAPPGQAKLDVDWLASLDSFLRGLKVPHWPRRQSNITVVADILNLNKWYNSKEIMEYHGLVADQVRLNFAAGVFWTSRLATLVALETCRGMVRDVGYCLSGHGKRGADAAVELSMEVLRQLNVLIERVSEMAWNGETCLIPPITLQVIIKDCGAYIVALSSHRFCSV